MRARVCICPPNSVEVLHAYVRMYVRRLCVCMYVRMSKGRCVRTYVCAYNRPTTRSTALNPRSAVCVNVRATRCIFRYTTLLGRSAHHSIFVRRLRPPPIVLDHRLVGGRCWWWPRVVPCARVRRVYRPCHHARLLLRARGRHDATSPFILLINHCLGWNKRSPWIVTHRVTLCVSTDDRHLQLAKTGRLLQH